MDKRTIIAELIGIADKLDEGHLTKEANEITSVAQRVAQMPDFGMDDESDMDAITSNFSSPYEDEPLFGKKDEVEKSFGSPMEEIEYLLNLEQEGTLSPKQEHKLNRLISDLAGESEGGGGSEDIMDMGKRISPEEVDKSGGINDNIFAGKIRKRVRTA
jgi:hypothetical protein